MHERTSGVSMRLGTRPHRAHRTLVPGIPWLRGIVSLILGLCATYYYLYLSWPMLMVETTRFADSTGRMTTPLIDSLLRITNPIPVPALPSLNLSSMLWIAAVSAALLILNAILPYRHAPLRYWIGANVAVLMLSAIYAFFVGRIAYDGASFMALVERTSILMILCAPVFIAFVAALLPFSIVELTSMLVLMVVFDSIFAVVRIAAFGLIVSHFGAIAEMNLYMFFGPLMDVVYFITVYSLVIVTLSQRLNQTEGAWQWS
jgi:hypothetical protein